MRQQYVMPTVLCVSLISSSNNCDAHGLQIVSLSLTRPERFRQKVLSIFSFQLEIAKICFVFVACVFLFHKHRIAFFSSGFLLEN